MTVLRLRWDLDKQGFVDADGQPLSTLKVKSGDTYDCQIQFYRDGAVVDPGTLDTAIFAVKSDGSHSGAFLTSATSWAKTGSGTSALWTFSLDWNTEELETELGSTATFVVLAGEAQVTFSGGDTWSTAEPLTVRFQRDYIVGDEGAATGATGATAGGDLSGTYPNPVVDGLQGRDLADTAPTNGQALIWNTSESQWEPGSAAAGSAGWGTLTGSPSDSTDVSAFAETLLDDADASAGRTTLGLGSAAVEDVGTSAGNVVQLDGSARLPAVDGSQLTNLPGGGGSTGWGDLTGSPSDSSDVSSFGESLLDDADAAAARTTLDVDQAGTDNSTDVTLSGSLDYLTMSGQEITRNAIDLATDVTGTVPVANGGTGVTALSSLDAADLGSGAATDGYVLTADGAGGAAWETSGGGGGPGSSTDWGEIGGTLSDQTDLQTALDAKLNAASVSTFGASLVDDADAAAARTTLGLGTLATQAADNVAITGGTLGGITSLILDELPPGPPAPLGEGQIKFANNQIVYGNGTAVTQTVAALAETQTLTNKTIDGGSNTLTNLPAANLTGSIADARVQESNVTQHEAALSVAASQVTALPCEIGVACSDETTDLTTGTAKVTFRMPYAMTLTAVRASVTTAPVGSTLVVDINESGTTLLSTKLSIDASEKTSTTAATAAVISDSALADDAEITIDIDQIGSSTAGAGLKVWLIGTRA